MHALLERVQRLQMLAVFECAARTGSFTEAAAELGMTQPAVSRHIGSLERAVGLDLFDRSANRVSLNATGRVLLEAVQTGFDTIELAVDGMQRRDQTFLVAANPGFAQQWLVPHLDQLQKELGDADLRLRLFDRDGELAGDDFDLAVHLMPIADAPATSRVLFDERVVPVASPKFAEEAGLDERSSPGELLAVTKLHLDARDRQWMDWAMWFEANGEQWSRSRARLLYNNHALVMNDAIAGRGVALAWRGLVDNLLETDALVPVGPEVHRPELAYQLIANPSAPTVEVDRVTNWLVTLTGP